MIVMHRAPSFLARRPPRETSVGVRFKFAQDTYQVDVDVDVSVACLPRHQPLVIRLYYGIDFYGYTAITNFLVTVASSKDEVDAICLVPYHSVTELYVLNPVLW